MNFSVIGPGVAFFFNLLLPLLTQPLNPRASPGELKLQHDNAIGKLNQDIAPSKMGRDVGQTSQLTQVEIVSDFPKRRGRERKHQGTLQDGV